MVRGYRKNQIPLDMVYLDIDYMEEFKDFEDCLQDECAKQVFADYIITRNIADFTTSEIPSLTPADFNKRVNIQE